MEYTLRKTMFMFSTSKGSSSLNVQRSEIQSHTSCKPFLRSHVNPFADSSSSSSSHLCNISLLAMPPRAAMEDCNQMTADCVVLSCCCQCLFLQFLVYVFLKLPRRLLHRTREYARKKLLKMRSRKKVETELVGRSAKFGDKFTDVYNKEESMSMCIDIDLLEELKKSSADHNNNNINDHADMGEHHHQCIEEIERVLDEYHAKGEFGFGSFWRKEVLKLGSPSSSSSSFSSLSPVSWGRSTVASSRPSHNSCSSSTERSSGGGAKKKKKKRRKESGGLRVVQFELIEIVHSLSLSSYGSFQKIDKLLDYERSSSGVWRDKSAS